LTINTVRTAEVKQAEATGTATGGKTAGGPVTTAAAGLEGRTLGQIAGDALSDNAMVNFGRTFRSEVRSTTPGAYSYWFKFGDIKHLTPAQVEAAIGQLASAGEKGGAAIMRVAKSPASAFEAKPQLVSAVSLQFVEEISESNRSRV